METCSKCCIMATATCVWDGILLFKSSPQSSEPLKTHFSDATCHVDDNISNSNYTNVILNGCRCHFGWYWSARCSVLLPAGRHRPTFPWVSVCMAALIRCDYWGQGPIWGHQWVKRVAQYNSGTTRLDPASILATGTTPPLRTMRAPIRWWLRLQGSILFSSASIHVFV